MARTQVAVLRKAGSSLKVNYTPSADVYAGDIVVINSIPHLVEADAIIDATTGIRPITTVSVMPGSVLQFPKEVGAISDRAAVYWHAAGDPYGATAGTGAVNTTSAGGVFVGFAFGGVGSTAATVEVIGHMTVDAGT